jgi:hypothetical protein
VAVRNNTNLMRNDLRALPFRPGQLRYAQNYYEAAGILAAMKAGVAPATIARPMQPLRIERVTARAETNGHVNGHASGRTNGNGKSRRAKSTAASPIAADDTLPELVEVVGK